MQQQLTGHRTSLAHLDATMRLFDPDSRCFGRVEFTGDRAPFADVLIVCG